MAFASYSSGGSRDGYTINGFNPPYKIGKAFTFSNITGRDAPNYTGNAAKPALVASISIDVQRYATDGSTAPTRFAMWESNGSGGAYSSQFNLPATSGTNPSTQTANVTKLIFANTGYIIGFTKPSAISVVWDEDNTFSGNIIQDNNSASGNFTNSANVDSGTLIYSFAYNVLPLEPNLSSVTIAGTTATLTWSANADTGGTPITGYRIQRSIDGVSYSNLIDITTTSTSGVTYNDTGLAYGSTYYYRVGSINAVATAAGSGYNSPWSNVRSVTLSPSTGNSTSTMTVTITNQEADPIYFSNAGAGIDFDAVELAYGSEKLFNRIGYSLAGGTYYVTEATSSQALYGIRTTELTNLLNSTIDDALDAANELLYVFRNPDLRIESIRVNLNNCSAVQQSLLLGESVDDPILNPQGYRPAEIDAAMLVEFTPKSGGAPISNLGKIIGIQHEISPTSHYVTLRMSRVDDEVFTLDSERLGILGDASDPTNPLGNILG